MMYIGGSTDDVFFVPWEQMLTVVGGGFILFFSWWVFLLPTKSHLT
ncbi:hypothetical protein OL548_02975 [Lysinibacillus sp. MHQ-1]|nr:hypothetical protein OL548_02975 [Lysinibacillus sp. MHQ-1]